MVTGTVEMQVAATMDRKCVEEIGPKDGIVFLLNRPRSRVLGLVKLLAKEEPGKFRGDEWFDRWSDRALAEECVRVIHGA